MEYMAHILITGKLLSSLLITVTSKSRSSNGRGIIYSNLRALSNINQLLSKKINYQKFSFINTYTKRNSGNCLNPNLSHRPSIRFIFSPLTLKYSTDHCGNDGQKSSSNKNCSTYNAEIECAVNEQILMEFEACYTYLSMACFFGNTSIALPGSHGFYMRLHDEEHEHALKLINYQNMRGGTVKLQTVTAPKDANWESIGKSLEISLQLEKDVKNKLIAVHDVAEKNRDLAAMDFIINFVDDQDKAICELSRLTTRYSQMNGCKGCGCSDFLFDRELYESFVRKTHSGKTYL